MVTREEMIEKWIRFNDENQYKYENLCDKATDFALSVLEEERARSMKPLTAPPLVIDLRAIDGDDSAAEEASRG